MAVLGSLVEHDDTPRAACTWRDARRGRQEGRPRSKSCPRRRGHGSADLAPLLVGHADQRGLGDARVGEHHRLDLGRVDVLAAGDEHVLRAALDGEEALVVLDGEVAGLQPAVADRLGGCLGPAPVAGGDVRAADQQLAGLVGVTSVPSSSTIFMSMWKIGIADRVGLVPHPIRRQPEVVAGRLGEAVAHLEVDAAVPELLHDRQRARGAAAR